MIPSPCQSHYPWLCHHTQQNLPRNEFYSGNRKKSLVLDTLSEKQAESKNKLFVNPITKGIEDPNWQSRETEAISSRSLLIYISLMGLGGTLCTSQPPLQEPLVWKWFSSWASITDWEGKVFVILVYTRGVCYNVTTQHYFAAILPPNFMTSKHCSSQTSQHQGNLFICWFLINWFYINLKKGLKAYLLPYLQLLSMVIFAPYITTN